MNRLKYIAVCSLFIFLFASCAFDGEQGGRNEEGVKYLSFVLENEFTGNGQIARSSGAATPRPETRGEVAGDDTYNENVFDWDNKDLHIFFFDYANQNNCLFYPESQQLSLEVKTEDGVEKRILKIKLSPDQALGEDFPPLDPDQMLGVNTAMYIVVNSGLSRPDFMNAGSVKPLADIRDIVVAANFNQAESGVIFKQDKFVMEAEESFYVPVWEDIITITLKRVAAKVQMGLYNASVDGYTANSAEVKLVNYVDKSPLSGKARSFAIQDGDYKSGDYISVTLPAPGTTPSTVSYADPFYSYPSDWSDDQSKGAYLLLKVNWTNTATQAAGDYYYKIPLSSIPSDVENGAAFRNSLRRNYIYRYYLTVTALGGDSPDSAMEISGNLDIMGWGDDEEIGMSIQKFDWLFVDEHNVVIYPVPGEDIQEYLIPYKSNTKLSIAGNAVAKYENYTGGNMTIETYPVVNYGSNPPDASITQYPYIDPNFTVGTQKYIRIRSRTPANSVPKYIYVKVNNEAELYAEIDITHYPALYVTAKKLSNGEISYTVTTLAITGDEWFSSRNYSNLINSSKSYKIGSVFRKNSNGKFELIEDNAENAWVVSPKFTISYNSSPPTQTRSGAIQYCQDRTEDDKSGWRLPTMAELYLIDKLQNDDTNVLKDALVGGSTRARAWSVGTYFLRGTRNNEGTIFQMRRALAGSNSIIRDERDPLRSGGLIGDYKHVPVCVRDVYQ